MTESEFIDQIDCNFPHQDLAAAVALMKLGASISPNAAFMVLYEICSVPYHPKVRPYLVQKRIELWATHFHHPINELIVPVAIKIVRNRSISISRCLKYLDRVAQYPGLYNALNIVSSSCNVDSGLIDEKCHKVTKQWSPA
jgi:hypothetical protein